MLNMDDNLNPLSYLCQRLHSLQRLKSSNEWDNTEIWWEDSITCISFSRFFSKSSFNSKSSTAPHDLQKMWWWCSFLMLDNSITLVLSGVWNSLIKFKSLSIFIILYKEDIASLPSDSLITSSTFRGPLFCSKISSKTILGRVTGILWSISICRHFWVKSVWFLGMWLLYPFLPTHEQ